MTQWFVVQTNPNQENKAALNLRRQDYRVWMPVFQKTRRHARKTDTVMAPLFPGYLFVSLHEQQGWRSINGTFGVRALLCQNARPLPVPAGFVEQLQAQSVDGDCIFAEPEKFYEGSVVRITDGAFEDCAGTIMTMSGNDRVTLLLKILGREVQTLMSRNQIMSAAA